MPATLCTLWKIKEMRNCFVLREEMYIGDEPNKEFSIKSLKEYTNLSQANLMYHLNELQKKGFIEKVERRSL